MCENYENAIVTFIDILGFGNIISEHQCAEVSELLNAIDRFTSPLHETLPDGSPVPYNPIVHSFSDSVIRIRPVERAENVRYRVGLLFHELLDLVHIQGDLVAHNIILRGAVSYGPICANNRQIYGPALIKAYELESKFALHPRIVIDPDLIAQISSNPLLRSEHNPVEFELEYISDLLKRGDDSFWFVDYLRAMESEVDDDYMYPNFLHAHKNLIISGAHRHALPDRVLQKYMWLAQYHNERIASLPNEFYEHHEIERESLLISHDELNSIVDIL